MAFSAINSSNIEVGDPVTAELWGLVKSNFDDHETRINSVEGGASKIVIINDLVVGSGQLAGASGSVEGVAHIRVPVNGTLTTAVISTTAAGSSGTTEIDVLKASTIAGTYTTVFSTKPSVTSAASPGSSSNAVFSTTAITAGEFLRVDLTSLQVGQEPFIITVFGDVS